eukprot:15437168-Alexandrium_andersonii.AAC.1
MPSGKRIPKPLGTSGMPRIRITAGGGPARPPSSSMSHPWRRACASSNGRSSISRIRRGRTAVGGTSAVRRRAPAVRM